MSEFKTTTEVLVQALPYIQRFRGKVVVVKLGGNAMVDPGLAEQFATDVVLMHSVGIKPVIVHGGGPQITELMGRLGKETEFKDGHRITDAESLEITRMVLVGKVNREIVSAINSEGSTRSICQPSALISISRVRAPLVLYLRFPTSRTCVASTNRE